MESILSDSTLLAGLIRPLVIVVVLLGIVAPLVVLAWKLIPDGKIKDALFKQRDV